MGNIAMTGEGRLSLYNPRELARYSYYIPNYQRGYRWGEAEVVRLLDDLWEFHRSDSESFYCLQPLIVMKRGEGVCYEVIDGQQRLTTIALIIRYFNEAFGGQDGLGTITLDYQTRPEIRQAMQCLKRNESGQESMPSKLSNSIDYWHMARAYEHIGKWFRERAGDPSFDEGTFRDTFLDKVKVIWYEVDARENPIAAFERNNIGKIPLTDSELIKALLLKRSNFNERNVLQRQLEIAGTWDRMERQLQQAHFWSFLFGRETRPSVALDALLALVLEVNFGSELKELPKSVTSLYARIERLRERDETFLLRLWERTQADYELACNWYEGRETYHYIGYLASLGVAPEKIYRWYRELGEQASAREFIEVLKGRIRELRPLKALTYTEEKGFLIGGDSPKNIYGSGSDRAALLLYNVQLCLREASCERFPFDEFHALGKKRSGWDIEHIDSQTEQKLERLEDQQRALWEILEHCRSEVKDLESEIESYLASEEGDQDQFDELYARVQQAVGEDEDEYSQSLGNLALLDAGTNRSYGNSFFWVKRTAIRSRDASGGFLPSGTRIAFMKYFAGASDRLDRWTREDKVAHERYIYSQIRDFIHSDS